MSLTTAIRHAAAVLSIALGDGLSDEEQTRIGKFLKVHYGTTWNGELPDDYFCTQRSDHSDAHVLKMDVLVRLCIHTRILINQAVTSPSEAYMKKWFGRTVNDETAEIICASTEALKTWCDSGPIDFVSKNWKGIIGACDKGVVDRELFLCSAFPILRWSWGELVGTILHELSHKVLGTDDLKYKGELAYGLTALKLAQDAKECHKSLDNAENWGYYLCEYRVDAGIVDSDRGVKEWQWLNPKDWIGGRTPFLSDTQGNRVNNALVNGTRVTSKKTRTRSPVKTLSPNTCSKCSKTFSSELQLAFHKKEKCG